MQTLLPTTRTLIDHCERGSADWRERDLLVTVILRHGSRADAEALLPVFLAAPERHAALVDILAAHGDATMAWRLAAECVTGDRLREGIPEGVLHALGYLGHEPAQGMLWAYAREGEDWGVQCEATLGLLHLSCQGLEAEISRELGRHEGQSLFPEMLPALAFKTGEPAWLERLVTWGERFASTDCNGGLILGVALHGAAGRPHFERLLWDERWETSGGGTGSERWAYAGTRVLGLSLEQVYGAARARGRSNALSVLVALLRVWLRRPWLGLRMASEPSESPAQVHALLRSSLELTRNVLGERHPLVATLHELERETRLTQTPPDS